MRELCHRCHGELPLSTSGDRHDEETAVLFCPRCGSPQILLEDHMRIEAPVVEEHGATTGALPPPRPGNVGRNNIDWRAAIVSGALVAAIGAVLSVLGMKFLAASFVATMWTISCAVLTLGLYARHRPTLKMDAKIGMRIGVIAGVLMMSAISLATAATGVVLRFGTHQMAQFDQESAQRRKELQVQFLEILKKNTDDKDLISQYSAALNSPQANSPEMLAGSALAGASVQGLILLLLSAGAGAFAGMMRRAQAQRLGQRSGD
jgi:hypothetical protein